jgi:hypothetical protein
MDAQLQAAVSDRQVLDDTHSTWPDGEGSDSAEELETVKDITPEQSDSALTEESAFRNTSRTAQDTIP